jgi:hypothetical protein
MAVAEPSALGPLTQISGPGPFGSCTADDVAGQEAKGSVNFPESELEPHAQVNPTNTRNVVAVWQQDRWSDGGSRGLLSAVSDDGGETWETVAPPQFSLCSNGIFERATDPRVSFGPDGTAYFMSRSLDVDPAIFSGHNGILVSKSVDGGHTWDMPVTLFEEDNPLALNDKSSITADRTNAHLVYATWDRIELSEIIPLEAFSAGMRFEHERVVMVGRMLRQMRMTVAEAEDHPPRFKGPAYFTRSTKSGETWERPRIIYDPGPDNQTINNLVEVMPNGVVVALFTEILNTAEGPVVNISLKRSSDQGFSFTPAGGCIRAQRIFTNAMSNPTDVVTPDDQLGVRASGFLFDSAVDPNNGNLYLVWQDNRFNGVDQIAFSQSVDGGASWSKPIKISQTPENANILKTQSFVPTVAVNSDGVVAVTYYDFWNDDRSGELTDRWIVFCDPSNDKMGNCAQAASWQHETRLTDASLDMREAPVAGALFLGDYMSQASANADFVTVFGITDGPDESSIFVRRAMPTPSIGSLPE